MQYYPVDTFFSSYVDELAQRASKRQAEGGERNRGPFPRLLYQLRLTGWGAVVLVCRGLWAYPKVALLLRLV